MITDVRGNFFKFQNLGFFNLGKFVAFNMGILMII